MSEDRFKEVFRRLTSETPDPPAFSDLETHRARPAAPIRLKPWMAAVGAAALVLVIVGAFGLLGGGGPDLAAPDENTIDYVKLEYSATVNPVCEGGEIIDNGGFDQATIEIWGPNSDNLMLMVATFPDGSTERTIVEGEPGNPDYIWVEGNPEEYPSNTRLRVVQCEGTIGNPGLNAFSPGSAGGMVPFHMLGPPPGFESFGESFFPGEEPIPTEWNGNAVLLYEFRRDEEAGSSAIDLYVTEDDGRALRFHAEQSLPDVGDVVVDYSVVDQDEVPADSVSFGKTGLTAIAQVFGLRAEDCPVTIPSQAFIPPDTHPPTPSDPDMVWFGKDELWTALSTDGISEERKSVWWSSQFTDPGTESSPEITVTYTLLNSETALTIVNDQGTNASTAEDGLFIIAGSEPDIEGCWQATAIYKDASLSYVYYNPEGQDPATATPTTVVPDVVGMTVDNALIALQDVGIEGSVSLGVQQTDVVCAQDPAAGTNMTKRPLLVKLDAVAGGCTELTPDQPSEMCASRDPQFGEITVYFHCGDSLFPQPQAVVRSEIPGVEPKAAVFIHLVAGPTDGEIDRGFASFFGQESASAVDSVEVQSEHLTVNFTEDITVNNASTSTGSTFFLGELYANAFQFEEVESVEFRINGSCEAFWEFLQAGPECNITNRADWEQIQSVWENG